MITTTLDLAGVPENEGLTRLLKAFDALAGDGSFTIVSDHDQRHVLRHLQIERRGGFDWSPLEDGPTLWRTVVRRRGAPDGLCLVSDYLQWDHRRLDALLDAARAGVSAADFGGAAGPFKEFSVGLRRHIRMEEQELFPAFEQATGMGGFGPTQVMRLEHLEIAGLLDSIARSLEAGDAMSFEAHVAELIGVLGDHNQKEERVVYPLTDRSLAHDQREELVRRMQAC